MEEENQEKNRRHYEKKYADHSIRNILHWLRNLDGYLDSVTTTETSWVALYRGGFREKIRGRKVLEMGCGDCTNAAVMAALGADVYANDIASASGEIIRQLNENFDFKHSIKFIEGDFLDNNLPSESFDFVVGKAFLHHLTIPVEKLFLEETARLLTKDGEARFFEPAVNSEVLDWIRWHLPVKGRPSKFNREAFSIWKENDPHPDRSFSSEHWEEAGKDFFEKVEVYPVGALERLSRWLKWGKKREAFRRKALQLEQILPYSLNKKFARSQLIVYRNKVLTNTV